MLLVSVEANLKYKCLCRNIIVPFLFVSFQSYSTSEIYKVQSVYCDDDCFYSSSFFTCVVYKVHVNV